MTIRYWRIKMLVAGIAFLLVPTTLLGQYVSEITQANQLYNRSQFAEAADMYERVISGGIENGHLYFNLGNTYFRMGDLSRAIRNYAKAQNLLPRDEDVEANLEYAVRQTVDQLNGRIPHFLESILFWVRDLNVSEHQMVLLWINLAFWVVMAIRLRHRTPATGSARNILLALLMLALVSTGFRWHQETRLSLGVVLPTQIDVHSGWKATTIVLFQLHQGALISISQEKENWYEIELPEGTKGWVVKSSIVK